MRPSTLYATNARGRGQADRLPGSVRLSRAVGQGGSNLPAEAQAVQRALNSVPEPLAGPVEKLAVDGLIGPRSLGAIRRFQAGWLEGVSDARLDPGGPTLACLNAAVGAPSGIDPREMPEGARGPAAQAWFALARSYNAAGGRAGFAAAPGQRPPPNRDFIAMLEAMRRLDDLRENVLLGTEMAMKAAVRMAERAFDYAGLLVTPSRGLPGWNSRQAPGRLAFLLLAKHFHLSEREPARALAAATRVLEVARRIMLRCVSRRGAFGVLFDQSDRYVATFHVPPDIFPRPAAYNAVLGGADRQAGPTGRRVPSFPAGAERTDRIYLTPLWDNADANWKQMTLIHELAHFTGGIAPGIEDHAYAHQAHYAQLTPAQRLRNTDTYAMFLSEGYFGTAAVARSFAIDVRVMHPLPHVEPDGRLELYQAPAGTTDVFAFPCGFPTPHAT